MTTTPPSLGRTLCAMITPFTPSGAPDLDGAQRLADHLVTEGCDGLVLSGTTGESPTTTDAEKRSLITAVREAVGSRATLVAGVGTPDTAHTVTLAREAEQAGADALLLVAPYYSRPPQDAIEAYVRETAGRDSPWSSTTSRPAPGSASSRTPCCGWPSTRASWR